MDRQDKPSTNPLSGIVPQDRRVTRSVTRALEAQVVGSILNQIDTGIERPIDFIPTDYLNRCADLVFGRASLPEVPTVRITDEVTVGSVDSSISYSRKIERLFDMSQGQENVNMPPQEPPGGVSNGDTSSGGLSQLMTMIGQQNQLIMTCMNEMRQMRGELTSLCTRVAEVECSGNAITLNPPSGSSSTPEAAPRSLGSGCNIQGDRRPNGLENEHHSLQQDPEGNYQQRRDPNRSVDITYSPREIEVRKPIDLDRWHIKFDGSGRDMTVESFIFRIERMREQHGISYSQLFSDFQCLVSGNAAKWFWQVREDNADDENFGYFALRRELLRQFSANNSDYEIIKEIMERKQQVGEEFEEFYTDIHNLTFRLRKKIPEKELVGILRSNLRSNLASLTFSANITTIAELKSEVKRAEKLLKESRQRSRNISELSGLTSPVDNGFVEIEAMSMPNKDSKPYKPNVSMALTSKTTTPGISYKPQSLTSMPRGDLPQKLNHELCPSPFHLNLCFTCGMPGDFYRKNTQEFRPENACRSTFHDMKCFLCGKDNSFCTYAPKNPQVAELTGNFCQTQTTPESNC